MMKSSECRKNWNLLVEVAEGKSHPEAEQHANTCQQCSHRLQELREMIRLTGLGGWDAPESLVAAARSIYQPPKSTRIAVLSSQGAAARSAATAPSHVVFEDEGVAVRLLIRPVGSGWRVIGTLESEREPISVVLGDQVVNPDAIEADMVDLDDLLIEFDTHVLRVPLSGTDANGNAPRTAG